MPADKAWVCARPPRSSAARRRNLPFIARRNRRL